MKTMKQFVVALLGVVILGGFAFGQEITVTVEQGLEPAITFANGGNADVIILSDDGGVYPIPVVEINVPLTIKAADGLAAPPEIHPVDAIGENDFIKINNDLTLDGIVVDGQIAGSEEYAQIKYMLKIPATQDDGSPNPAPSLIATNCTFKNMYTTGDPATSADGSVWDVTKGGFCDVVSFENCTFENTGDECLRAINGHKSDHVVASPMGGHFNSFTVKNCTFVNINGSSVKLQGDARTDNDSPPVLLENLTFNNCGGQVIWIRAIDGVTVRNIIVANGKMNGTEDSYRAGRIMYVEGEGSTIAHVDTFAMARVVGVDTFDVADYPFVVGGSTNVEGTAEGSVDLATVYGLDPMFADAANNDYTISGLLLELGEDGGAMGDLNWATNELRTIQVTVDQGLPAAVDFANAGNADVIELVDAGGVYAIPATEINVPLIIRAPAGLAKTSYPGEAAKPEIHPVDAIGENDFITINNDLILQGIAVDGMIANSSEYAQIKYMLKVPATQDEGSPNPAPLILATNCEFRNMYTTGDPATSVDGSVWDVTKGGFCDVVSFENCIFENTGDECLRAINGHKSDHVVSSPMGGHIGAFKVKNCTFVNVNGSSIKLQGDARTDNASPSVVMDGLTFYGCGGQVIWIRAIDGVQVRNMIITDAKVNGTEDSYRAGRIMYVEGEGSSMSHITTYNMARIVGEDTVVIADQPFVVGGSSNVEGTAEGTLDEATIYDLDPMFADAAAGDFSLLTSSPVLTLASDGGALGDRTWGTSEPSAVDDIAGPSEFSLSQNYPNPFNPTTSIQFTLAKNSAVALQVYNVKGVLIETLKEGKLNAGSYNVKWDASKHASGVYFYRLKAGDRVVTKKMMLIK